jgi:hypothetical protein
VGLMSFLVGCVEGLNVSLVCCCCPVSLAVPLLLLVFACAFAVLCLRGGSSHWFCCLFIL